MCVWGNRNTSARKRKAGWFDPSNAAQKKERKRGRGNALSHQKPTQQGTRSQRGGRRSKRLSLWEQSVRKRENERDL